MVNPLQQVAESDFTNNRSKTASPVLIEAPLPELAVTGLDVPPVMQPGDTIQPNIQIANFGTADTTSQGPVTVALVASRTLTFGPGSSILAEYTVSNIPAVAQAPSQNQVLGDDHAQPAERMS